MADCSKFADRQLCVENDIKVRRRLSNLDGCWQHWNVTNVDAANLLTCSKPHNFCFHRIQTQSAGGPRTSSHLSNWHRLRVSVWPYSYADLTVICILLHQFHLADDWCDWVIIDGLILIDSLNALANCLLLSCRMWATVDGIHRSVLVVGRSLH